jgi:MarR family 2-MHQ and catechol resistance regulon transcriptional repressor
MKLKQTKSYGQKADKSMATWMEVYKTYHKIRAKELTYISSFDITMNQFEVLEVLYHRGDMNIGMITKLILSTPGNVTVVVRNLKRDGYVDAYPDLKDKRASILSITPKGKELIEALFPNHAKNFEAYFEVLSDEEMETLFRLLRKLHKEQ